VHLFSELLCDSVAEPEHNEYAKMKLHCILPPVVFYMASMH